MQNIKTLTLSLIIGISLAAGITFAATNWQGCTDCGTDGITTGSTISAENIKANFDYLYDQVATGGIWTKSGTDMYYNDGNIGIGTTAPTTKLDVRGQMKIGREGIGGTYNSSQVQGIWSIAQNYKINTTSNNFGNQYGMVYAHTNAGTSGTNKPIAGFGHQILFTGNGVRKAAISLTGGNAYFAGNVGIGTTAPSNKLEVAGKIEADEYCDRSGQNCINMSSIVSFMNRSWYNVLGSRSEETTYTNNRDYPIEVAITTEVDLNQNYTNFCKLNFYINGALIALAMDNSSSAHVKCSGTWTVPPGDTYKMKADGYREGKIYRWYELY